jgi:NAD(P)H-dependent flavin oxidoreductase YrpB (nitropropane dioxygenase family)
VYLFAQLVGLPGAIATPQLAAAVSEAGRLGMLGASRAGITPAALSALIDAVRTRTGSPFGVKFPGLVIATCASGPQMCRARRAKREVYFGEQNRDLVAMVHAGGTLVSWQVGSREEALSAQTTGCDLIVVQGTEAGGFNRGTIGLHALLDAALSEVDVPVLAAGGIGNGRAMAAALAAGAPVALARRSAAAA